jgi:hypothetical protein
MMRRWRGLKSLIVDAVEHGSRAVEHIQKETAKLPFDILEQIPALEVPVKGIREIHDVAVSGVHGMIRLVNRVVGETLDVALDVIEHHQAKQQDAVDDGGSAPEPSAHDGASAPRPQVQGIGRADRVREGCAALRAVRGGLSPEEVGD